ncbi:ABC transporter ATP-binding protein [Candidatus Poriferisodalis sp.]|uniref:ABC transporter ATP-binding protein n=1 Tax=Candidatus Poriferisodalis sp. TaxID=3101277 RepID=UPI003B52D511
MTALIEIDDLFFDYHARTPRRDASDEWTLRDIAFTMAAGSTVGIVGESGSGKSTLVRLLCGLLVPSQGQITFDGQSVKDWLSQDRREFHRRNQIVFQSPASSLDPRLRVRTSLSEPTKALEQRKPGSDELGAWLTDVGLSNEILSRYPHQLSGGQLQRIAVARALSVQPDVLYADEPTSALDVSVQAQVLNLLMGLKQRHGLTLVLVSHDLAVVARVCEQVIVLKDGQVVEAGSTAEVMSDPKTDYTRTLVEASRATSLIRT